MRPSAACHDAPWKPLPRYAQRRLTAGRSTQPGNGFSLPVCALLTLALGLGFTGALAHGQDVPLFEQEPYDEITLDAVNNNTLLRVFPLDLPGRRVPSPLPKSGQLVVRLLDRPSKQYAIEWYSIAKIELFEQLVLNKANELVRAGKLDEAYPYFQFLEQKDPTLPGLAQGIEDFLYEEAKAAFRAGQYEASLAMLRELYGRNPQRPDLEKALGISTDKLVQQYVEAGNYAAARALVRHLAAWYAQHEIVTKWHGQWQQTAATLLAEAQQALQSGDLRKADQAGRRLVDIWPGLPGAKELMQEIHSRYGRVQVGVTVLATRFDASRLDDGAARRSSRLVYRTLMEFAGPGREGGRYDCPLGEARLDNLGRRLLVRLKPHVGFAPSGAQLTGYDLARHLLAMADPAQPMFQPAWADLVTRVSVSNVYEVQAELSRAHVRPEALLQTVVPPYSEVAAGAPDVPSNGPYQLDPQASSPEQRTYVVNPHYFGREPGQAQEIVEILVPDADRGLRLLRARQIDVLDRVNPWDLRRFRAQGDLAVEPYALPLVHCLVPNLSKPVLAHRGLRRAILYGIHREAILKQLLAGQEVPGCQVISGPFSAGLSADDPLDYAYDTGIKPRPYDPRLAMALAEVAFREIREMRAKRGESGPAVPTLIVAHPPHPIARLACEAIQRQLKLVGIPVELRAALPPDRPQIPADVDLMYAELAMWEPLVDAGRLLDTDGLAGGASPYMALALRQLDQAADWPDIGRQLRRIHRLVHEEVAIIPLWQLLDHFAYHKSLQGVASRPVSLYQDVERWRPGFYYPQDEP